MASSPAPEGSSLAQRRFQPICVGKCYKQTAMDRFGAEGKAAVRDRERAALAVPIQGAEIPFAWPGNELTDEGGLSHTSVYRRVPSMQSYRNNLTALSQVYNLYFSAYQGRVFVYVPRHIIKQRLPGTPDMQLIPKPSNVASRVGGYLEPLLPHAINNMVTGFLGDEEVLVICHDDGDVTAYYTREVAEWLAARTDLPVSQATKVQKAAYSYSQELPTPFFLENVGASAWGLAVHAKSRLIAVSSNRWEVTVFAPALSRPTPLCSKSEASGRRSKLDQQVELFVRQRSRNWRIVVVFDYNADNIPNVCFLDDDDGHAEKVCAIDIRGSLWLAEIWRSRQPLKRIQRPNSALLHSEEFWPEASRGWGVLALRKQDFKTVNSVEELVGGTLQRMALIPVSLGCTQPMANIYSCVREIPDNPCPERGAGTDRPAREPVMFQGQEALQVLADVIAGAFDHVDEDNEDELEELLGLGDVSGSDPPTQSGSDEEAVDLAALADITGNFENESFSDDIEEDHEFDPEQMEGVATGLTVVDDDDISESSYETADSGLSTQHANIFTHPAFQALNTGHLGTYMQNTLDEPSDGEAHGFSGDDEPDDESSEDNWPGSIGDALWEDEDDEENLHTLLDETMAQLAQAQPEDNDEMTGDEVMGHVPLPVTAEEYVHVPGTDNAQPLGLHPSIGLEQLHSSGQGGAVQELDEPQDMVYFPHTGQVREVSRKVSELASFLLRRREHNDLHAKDERNYSGVTKKYHLLRTLEKDLELRDLRPRQRQGKSEIGILCPDVLTFGDFGDRMLRPFFRAASRLNMVVHVPELSMVVVGSPVGRVLLLTPTRLASKQVHEVGFWHYGFRVEWILPRSSEEIQPKEARRPLHGLAIGPVQDDMKFAHGQGKVDKTTMPLRYRLMLHYRNHDILTYEITRDEQTDKLCIF